MCVNENLLILDNERVQSTSAMATFNSRKGSILTVMPTFSQKIIFSFQNLDYKIDLTRTQNSDVGSPTFMKLSLLNNLFFDYNYEKWSTS